MLKGRGASSLIKDIVGEVKDSPRLSQDHLAPTLTRATCTLSQVRQVNEAVRIGMSDAECLMNSKSEFHQAPLVRVVATTGLQDEQDERLDGVSVRGRRGRRGGRRNGEG